jgi:hypothetical protein
MEAYTLADAQFLTRLKNTVRSVTKLLDETGIKKYLASQESHEVKHAVLILLSELQFHDLLPDGVTISSSSAQGETQVDDL